MRAGNSGIAIPSPFNMAQPNGLSQGGLSNPFAPANSAAPSDTNLASPEALAAPQSLFPPGAINPENAENRMLLFDIDETLASRVRKSDKAALEKAGYKVYEFGKDENGYVDEYPYFIERPGARELLQKLVAQGFVLVASSRNMPHHVNKIVNTLGLGEFFVDTMHRFDLVSKDNQDFKRFPQHPNNVGVWKRFTDWLSRNTVGWIADAWRWIKSKIFKGQPFFRNTPVGVVNKYPPRLCGARVLFDDKSENKDHSLRSKDWVHVQIQPFHGTVEGVRASEAKDESGQYKWWKEFLAATDALKDPGRGWQGLYKTVHGADPKPSKVEVSQAFNDKFSKLFGFRL